MNGPVRLGDAARAYLRECGAATSQKDKRYYAECAFELAPFTGQTSGSSFSVGQPGQHQHAGCSGNGGSGENPDLGSVEHCRTIGQARDEK